MEQAQELIASQHSWYLWVLPLLLTAFLVAYSAVRLLGGRIGLGGRANAEILRLTPQFRRSSSIRTTWVHCEYMFQARGTTFSGSCLLPLSYFVRGTGPLPAIHRDARLDLPVFSYQGQQFVGAESIEHFLLGQFDSVRVSYRTRDPAHNHLDATGSLRARQLENRASGS